MCFRVARHLRASCRILRRVSDSDNWLVCDRLRDLAAEAAKGGDADRAWRQMERLLETADLGEDADLMLPVLEKSLPDLHALLQAWDAGRAPLPAWDKAVLKRAMKAFRKRLKLARLDDESSASRNPLSKGETSRILGVRPPEQYPALIWDRLIAQGRLRDGGHGLLEPVS